MRTKTTTKPSGERPLVLIPILACMLVGGIGCRTVPQADMAAFAGGVTQAKQQANLAFQTLNELSRENTIAVAITKPTLDDENLVVLLDPDSVANWERAFTGIQTYAAHLMALTSPNLTDEYKQYAVDLAKQIKATGESLTSANLIPKAPEVSAPLAAGFIKIGDILIRAQAQAKARAVLREVDPDVAQLFATMAKTIGTTRKEGLRGTAWAHGTQRMGELTPAFLEADTPQKKRSVVEDYLEARDSQLTHDAALAALERSLQALANAHRSLAEGRNIDAVSALALITTEVEDTKKLHDELKKSLNPQP